MGETAPSKRCHNNELSRDDWEGYIFTEFSFELGTTDEGKFYFGGGGRLNHGIKRFTGGSYEANKEWYHVVGTYSPGAMDASWSFFVDGVLIWADSGRAFSLSSDIIGSGVGGAWLTVGKNMNGLIEEVKVYPRALSGDEIAERYRAGPSL